MNFFFISSSSLLFNEDLCAREGKFLKKNIKCQKTKLLRYHLIIIIAEKEEWVICSKCNISEYKYTEVRISTAIKAENS